MEGHLVMNHKELRRKSVLEVVQLGGMSLVEASDRMGLSYRQTLRVYQRFLAEGDAGLVHRRRGQASNRGYPPHFREQVLERYRERYQEHGLGPTLAAEKLAEDGLVVDHETLRRWLLAAGEWKRRRRRRRHRSRRERRAHFGELVQMDGSHHPWFGPDEDRACLMNMVDDARGMTMGLMADQETTEAAMGLLRRWVETHGIPRALYTDKKNVYLTDRAPTLEEQLAGEKALTAFGKACQKLGIEIIPAHSPQAKGRVERSNGVYQDRLVKELALAGVTNIAGANALLANGFTDALNARFAIAPLEDKNFHRPVPKGVDLDDVFCFESTRVVQNDWTLRHKNTYYQIHKDNTPLPKPKTKVLVRIHLDGRVQLLHKGKPLSFTVLRPEQLHQQRQRAAPGAPLPPRTHHKPPPPKKHWRPNVGRLVNTNRSAP
ncbi:MAG: ISNCY family transposase [Candidatus Hydrogenedentales bacterium]